jgi:hypothetical protein
VNGNTRRHALEAYRNLLSLVSEQPSPHAESAATLREMEETLLCVSEFLQWRLFGGHIGYGVFGTTSSGKSTLLNLLTGHRLLPTDADELSAGITTISHATDLSAHLHYSTDAGPVRAELRLEEASTRLAAHLRAFKHARGDSTRALVTRAHTFALRAPLVDLEFWFGASPAEVTLVDLPGLRIADDQPNRPFIELAARNLHPLIVTDIQRLYMPELVEEVCNVITGNAMLHGGARPVLIVNKTDAHDASSRSVHDAVERFRGLVHTGLGADIEPRVVAVSAMGLECAMGLRRVVTEFALEPDAARDMLITNGAFLVQTADRIFRAEHLTSHRENRQKARRALRRLEDALESDSMFDVSVADCAELARFVFVRSGGASLRETLTDMHTDAPRVKKGLTEQDLPGVLPSTSTRRKGSPPVGSIASMFWLVINADGVIDAREIETASILLREYLQVFWRMTWDDVSSEPVELFISNAGEQIEPFEMEHGEYDWLMGALEMLAASDWTIDPEEVEAIAEVEARLSSPS